MPASQPRPLSTEEVGRVVNDFAQAAANAIEAGFADALLAEHPFVLIPSAVTRHSWNLLVSCDLVEDTYRLISQERFGLDTRLIKV